MYHEKTYREVGKARKGIIVFLIELVIIFVLVIFVQSCAQRVAREQAVTAVHDAVITAATQCCAIEGSYPSSLSHLEKSYGLVINHNDYVVLYEWLGDNVEPSVVVRLR